MEKSRIARFFSKHTSDRSKKVVDVSSNKKNGNFQIGDRVCISGVKTGVLKFYGETKFAEGIWCGIELDDPEGKHNGTVKGINYFESKSDHGIFAPVSKVQLAQTPEASNTVTEHSQEKNFLKYPSSGHAPLSRLPSKAHDFGLRSSLEQIDRNDNASDLDTCPTLKVSSGHGHKIPMSEPFNRNSFSRNAIPSGNEYRKLEGELQFQRNEDVLLEALQFHEKQLPGYQNYYSNGHPQLMHFYQKQHPDGQTFGSNSHHSMHLNQKKQPVCQNFDGNGHYSVQKQHSESLHVNKEDKNALSPIYEFSDELGKRMLAQTSGDDTAVFNEKGKSAEAPNVAAMLDELSPVSEIFDGDGSCDDSLGILTPSQMKDVWIENQLFPDEEAKVLSVHKTFSCDEVSDLPEDKLLEDLMDQQNSNCSNSPEKQCSVQSELFAKNGTVIPSPVEAQKTFSASWNVPNTVDISDVFERCLSANDVGMFCTEGFNHGVIQQKKDELTDVTLRLKEDISPPKELNYSAETQLQKVAIGTLVDKIVIEDSEVKQNIVLTLPLKKELTEENISSLIQEGDDKKAPGRPLSAYTAHSSDTGFQGDSELDNQSEVGTATLCSPCENKVMHWSTCSQDSGAVSESSEMQRRHLHPDCCSDGALGSKTTQPPPSENLDSEGSCETLLAKESSEQENKETQNSESDTQVTEPISEECTTSEPSVDVSKQESKQNVVQKPKTELPTTEKKESSSSLKKKFSPRPPKQVVSKIKAMIEASSTKSKPDDNQEKKVTPKPAKKNRWDAVTSKIAASLADEKSKSKLKVVKSRVNTNLSGARQTPPRKVSSKASVSADSVTSDQPFKKVTPYIPEENASQESQNTQSVAEMNAVNAQKSNLEKKTAHVQPVKKTTAPVKKPDYPKPWKTAPLEKENKPATQTTAQNQSKRALTNVLHISRKPRAVAETEFTKEIQRLGALCESRTKELNFVKMQLKHSALGFSALGVVVRYLTEELNGFKAPLYEKQLSSLEGNLEHATKAIEQYEQELGQLKEEHLNKIEKQKLELQEHHEETMKALEEQHTQKVNKLKTKHEQELKKREDFHIHISEEEHKQHQTELESLKQSYKTKLEELTKEFRTELQRVEEEYEECKNQLLKEREEIQKEKIVLQAYVRKVEDELLKDSNTKVQWLSKKNKDLEKDIESLNSVLDMKGVEIKILQNKNLELEKQVEEFERCQERIKRLEARNEDLQALIKEKAKLQRQLSCENEKLREHSEKETRRLSRIAMDKEQLLYRLQQSMYETPQHSSTHSRLYGAASSYSMPRSYDDKELKMTLFPSHEKPSGTASMSKSWHSEVSMLSRKPPKSRKLPHKSYQEPKLAGTACTNKLPEAHKICYRRAVSTPAKEPCSSNIPKVPKAKCIQEDALHLTWVSSPEYEDRQSGSLDDTLCSTESIEGKKSVRKLFKGYLPSEKEGSHLSGNPSDLADKYGPSKTRHSSSSESSSWPDCDLLGVPSYQEDLSPSSCEDALSSNESSSENGGEQPCTNMTSSGGPSETSGFDGLNSSSLMEDSHFESPRCLAGEAMIMEDSSSSMSQLSMDNFSFHDSEIPCVSRSKVKNGSSPPKDCGLVPESSVDQQSNSDAS